MQAVLARAGTALLIVVALSVVLTATDTLSASMSATFPDSDAEGGLIQRFTHHPGPVRVVEAVIPVGRKQINVEHGMADEVRVAHCRPRECGEALLPFIRSLGPVEPFILVTESNA